MTGPLALAAGTGATMGGNNRSNMVWDNGADQSMGGITGRLG
jgi:hypothetical protein